jgi:hypothetical protein
MVKRWMGLSILAGLLLLAAEGSAWAECGNCQVCKENANVFGWRLDYCVIANDEDGWMCCSPEEVGVHTYCRETGDACHGIIVDGGGGSGGGGGGGGGSNCSYQSGWCPPSCMSCSGGGRPRI